MVLCMQSPVTNGLWELRTDIFHPLFPCLFTCSFIYLQYTGTPDKRSCSFVEEFLSCSKSSVNKGRSEEHLKCTLPSCSQRGFSLYYWSAVAIIVIIIFSLGVGQGSGSCHSGLLGTSRISSHFSTFNGEAESRCIYSKGIWRSRTFYHVGCNGKCRIGTCGRKHQHIHFSSWQSCCIDNL